MVVVARCHSLGEAQEVRLQLQHRGIVADVLGANLASWRLPRIPRSAAGVHVAVLAQDVEAAAKVIKERFPHLSPTEEEVACRDCVGSNEPPKPYTRGLLGSLWLLVKVRIFGFLFCPGCHRAWRRPRSGGGK